MKTKLLIFFILLIACLPKGIQANNSIQQYHAKQDTTSMKKYQTFDEFTMRGIGTAKASPFVYVKEMGDSIYVVSSCPKDSARLYVKLDDNIWYSHMEYDMRKRDSMAYKSEECRIARTYDRYFYNDTIVEIHTGFIEGEKYPSVIVKTQKELYEIDIDDIKSSEYTNINNLRRYVYATTHSNGKNVWKSYLEESTDNYSYIGIKYKSKYHYIKKAYGLWGIQPGVKETFLYEGIDIREYADNLKGFQNESPDYIYELADEMPSFPNGTMAFYEFCKKKMEDSLLFSHDTKKYDARVVVEIVIEKDGSITNAKISKSIDPLHDKDALRIVKKMPKWIPAKLNGKNVRCRQLIPILYMK